MIENDFDSTHIFYIMSKSCLTHLPFKRYISEIIFYFPTYIEFLMVQLACLKTGACFSPVFPTSPPFLIGVSF